MIYVNKKQQIISSRIVNVFICFIDNQENSWQIKQ